MVLSKLRGSFMGNCPQGTYITGETENGCDDQPLDVSGKDRAKNTYAWDTETAKDQEALDSLQKDLGRKRILRCTSLSPWHWYSAPAMCWLD